MENQSYQKENIFRPQRDLPNATAVLVLGIVGILGCFCYGVAGLICSIIALVLAKKDNQVYLQSSGDFTASSYANLKAGRICAIIGLCLSILAVFIFIGYAIFITSFLQNNPDFMKNMKYK